MMGFRYAQSFRGTPTKSAVADLVIEMAELG
jgi:hypothetical protein